MNEKPILDVQAVQANGDHFKHWETRFHDYCLLGGYRDPIKDRITQTDDHYIAAKRPFEIAVLRTAIPNSEWNTIDDVIAPKIPVSLGPVQEFVCTSFTRDNLNCSRVK